MEPKTPAKVDILGTKLLHLLRRSTAKLAELKELVQKESELVGYCTLPTITPVLQKQEDIKRNVTKCLSSIENASSPAGSSGYSSSGTTRGRSLTVTIRDSELRRQAAKSGTNIPSTSSSTQDLHVLCKGDPLPVASLPCNSPKRRSGSLDRIQVYEAKSTVSESSHSSGFGTPPIPRHDNSVNNSGALLNPNPNPPMSLAGISGYSRDCTVQNITQDVSFDVSRIPPMSLLDKNRQPKGFHSQPHHGYSSPWYEPAWSDNQSIGKPESENEFRTSTTEQLLLKPDSVVGNKAADLIPPLPTLSAKHLFPYVSTSSLRSMGQFQNEVTKPFETEDVEKYSVKKSNSRRQAYVTDSSPVSPALSSSIHSDCSSGREDDQSQSGHRPLRELHRNMGLLDQFHFRKEDGQQLREENEYNLPFQMSSYAENGYKWEYTTLPPDIRELRRRVNNFRFTKGADTHPMLAIQCLRDIELKMLIEVLAHEPRLLTPEEIDYLLEEYDERKAAQGKEPPQLPPKYLSRHKIPPPSEEADDDTTDGAGAWGPVKPTIV